MYIYALMFRHNINKCKVDTNEMEGSNQIPWPITPIHGPHPCTYRPGISSIGSGPVQLWLILPQSMVHNRAF
jgi:hypothetical protein